MIKYTLMLLAILLTGATTLAEANKPILTVQETLGLVFTPFRIDTRESGERVAAFYAAVNPAAKPQLYRILSQPALAKYHGPVMGILGNIGDAKDAAEIERYVKGLSGELPASHPGVHTALISLGEMSRRGVKEATEILAGMCDKAYWKQVPITWPGLGPHLKHDTADELTARSLLEYARAGAPDWKAKAAAYAETLKDPQLQREMLWRVGSKYLSENLRDQETRAKRPLVPLDPEMRGLLPQQFNGDLENPGPAQPDSRPASAPRTLTTHASEKGLASAPLSPASAALVKEGFAEYQTFVAAVTKGDYESVLDRLVSDGEPKSVKEMKSQWKEAKADFELERKLLQLPAVRDAKCVDWTLRQSGTDRFESLTPEGSPVEPRAGIRTILTFKLEGTKGLFAQIVGPGDRNTNTFAPDGSLVVLMMKIDGKWYWNPFGS